MSNSATKLLRPQSPNIQIYRPQLTSVLSIANRITGVMLSIYAVLLVGYSEGRLVFSVPSASAGIIRAEWA